MHTINGLEHLKPTRHPLREVFRRNGVTYAMLARHCECSVGWIGQLMAGYRPMPKHMAAKLYELAERLEPGSSKTAARLGPDKADAA